MAAPLVVPVGEKASLGVSKETVFNTFVAPVLFHAIEDATMSPKNIMNPRAGARKRRGQTLPVAGGFEGSGSMTVESEPDTVPQLLAYACGNQVVPVLVSTSVYSTTFNLAADLPSFSIELNRVTDTVDYTGCMVDSLALSVDRTKGMMIKIGFVYASEAIQASPTTPTFSTLAPLTAENASNTNTMYGVSGLGLSGAVAVLGWDVNLSNNLLKGYFSIGNGRTVINFPQQQRKVAGTVKLGFEDHLAYQNFLGSATATAPQATVPGVSLDMVTVSTDTIASSYKYTIETKCPNVFLEAHSAPVKAATMIEQSFSFFAAESANGAQDDLTIYVQNARSTIY